MYCGAVSPSGESPYPSEFAAFPDHGSAVDALLLTADRALYRGKEGGRDPFVVADATEGETKQHRGIGGKGKLVTRPGNSESDAQGFQSPRGDEGGIKQAAELFGPPAGRPERRRPLHCGSLCRSAITGSVPSRQRMN